MGGVRGLGHRHPASAASVEVDKVKPAQRMAMKRTPRSAGASMASASATSLTKRQTALERRPEGGVGAQGHVQCDVAGEGRSSAGICVACMYAAVEKTVSGWTPWWGRGPAGGTGAGRGGAVGERAARASRADRDRYFDAASRVGRVTRPHGARRGATSEEEIRVAFNIVAARSVCGWEVRARRWPEADARLTIM